QDQLTNYLNIAAENNPQLQALFTEYLATLEEMPQAKALPDPQLMFSAFLQPIETRVGPQRASLSFSQMFPWFGTLTAREDVVAQQAEAKLQMLEDAKQELFKQVKVTYNELYYLQAATNITRRNLKLLASFKELARVNFEGGQVGFADVLRIEIEEEGLRNKLQYLEESHEPLITQFEQLLNQNLTEAIVLPDSLWTEDLLFTKDSVFQIILANNPQLEAIRYQAQSFQSQVVAVQKMSLPSFTLGGSYINIDARTDREVPDNGRDAILFPQVGVRLPLYRKKYNAMEKQVQLQKDAVLLQGESIRDRLLTQLENLYHDYRDAQRRVRLNRRLADLAERTLNLLQTEFMTNEADFEEIIRAEQQLLEYQLNYERAQVERNNDVYSIQYLMGKSYEK
ncbi:MAG: TolC family protein, partial [Bacteroidota bacterium]